MTAPHIADEGRDGHPFGVIDLWSDPGAWADALRFSVNIRILPDAQLKQPLDAVEGRPDAPGAADESSFHADPNDTTSKDNHHV